MRPFWLCYFFFLLHNYFSLWNFWFYRVVC